jgi:hypothetical protein
MSSSAGIEPDLARQTPAFIPDEYGKIIELHKFYLEIGTKAAAGFLTVIGAILAYVSENRLSDARMSLALGVPLLLSAGNMIVFMMGTFFARDFARQVRLAQERVGALWRPHVEFVVGMTIVAGLLFLLLTCALLWVMIDPSVLLGAAL